MQLTQNIFRQVLMCLDIMLESKSVLCENIGACTRLLHFSQIPPLHCIPLSSILCNSGGSPDLQQQAFKGLQWGSGSKEAPLCK